ncbi:hypothetical protein H4P12_14915 [Paracoccus sp. 11-3]|uniref:Uncharacterized protein n=1 Tax=Paracoccus amoyensis TaxID=2760093 RepID=A0A926GBH6_9RHOB|nr:hypothetical protein [Paracoccus amoyensis]MBC9247968.1 hypothetical protein [Paracoccus amoyensis]
MTADDKEFNPFEFTASVSAALRTGDVDKAKEIVQLTIAKGTLSPTNYRATNAQNLIRAVEEQHLRIEDLTAGTSAERFDVIYAKARALNAVLGIPPYLNRKSERGRYETRIPANPVVMTHEFSDVPSDELSLLETAGFCKPAALHEACSIFVERDCRVSALGGDDMTIVTDEGFYHPRRSSRVAKVSHSIALRKPEGRLPEACILPFAHSAGNY